MTDRTHGDSCWRDPAHHACAVAEVERVGRELNTCRAALRTEWERAIEMQAGRDQMIDLYMAQCQESTQLVADARTALELRIEAQHQRDEAEAEVERLLATLTALQEAGNGD